MLEFEYWKGGVILTLSNPSLEISFSAVLSPYTMQSRKRVTTITTVTRTTTRKSVLAQPCSLRACCSLRDQTKYRLFPTRKWIKLRPYEVPIQSYESVIRRVGTFDQTKSMVSSQLSNAKVTMLGSERGETLGSEWGIRAAAEDMRRVSGEMRKLEMSLSQLVSSMEHSRASISP